MKLFMLLIVVLVSLVGGGFYFLTQNQTSQNNSAIQKNDSAETTNTGTTTKTPEQDTRYIEYTPGILVNTGDAKQVLFFYANWCPTCRPADENFKTNSNMIPEDVILIRVNYNDQDTDEQEKGLAQHYGVTYQHTFIQLDKDGNVVAKWNGGQIEELLANIK
jgi:uncharacterized protein YxeA